MRQPATFTIRLRWYPTITAKNLREINAASSAASPVSNAQQRGAGELRRGRDHDDVVGADAADDGRAERLIAAAKQEALCADRAEHELAVGIAVEQIEDLPLGEVLADDLAVGDGVDAEQRLVDMERAPDRLHGAARPEQIERAGARLDVLAQLCGDVVLDRLFVRSRDQRLGGLHVGRLEWRPRRHVEPDRPFVAAVFVLVQVDDFDVGQADLLA